MKIYLFTLLFLVSFPITYASDSNDSVRVSRYLIVEPQLPKDLLWPLEHVVDFDAARHNTIGIAITDLLAIIGYELHPQTDSASHILNKPVPRIHAQFEHLKIHQIIHAMIGRSYQIIADPATRQISFRLAEKQG